MADKNYVKFIFKSKLFSFYRNKNNIIRKVNNRLINKNCLIITFANDTIGSGHLFRSQILAKKLRKKNWKIFLFGPNLNNSKNIKKSIFKKIFFLNFKNNTLPKSIPNNVHKIIKQNQIGLVVIDSYLIKNEFQKKIKDKLILKITNTKDNNQFCDFILDYSFHKSLNKNPKNLLGPKYALVDKIIFKKNSQKKKLLITFGGSNLNIKFEPIISILSKKLPHYKIYISTTSFNYAKILRNNLSKKIKVIYSNNLIKTINIHKFELIIASMGHTMYQLMVHRYPSLFIKFFKNQNFNFVFFRNQKLLKCIDYNQRNFLNIIESYLENYKKDKEFFNISKKISDKINLNGAELVAEKLDSEFVKKFYKDLSILDTKRLKLIPLSKKNISNLFNLRSKISLKNNLYFKNNVKILKKNHFNWFENYLSHKRVDYLIYEKKYKKFIGSLSFKLENDKIQIGKYISEPNFWGRGYGFEASKKWIDFGINYLGFSEVIALTHKKNDINIALNKKLGFKKNKLINKKWLKMTYKSE